MLEFSEKKYTIIFEPMNRVAQRLKNYLPFSSEAHNIGGEIYFRANGVDIAYDGTECEEFFPGDVVYWRSPTEENIFAIALFYGPTKYSNWSTSRASSPCVKIGHIQDPIDSINTIQTGDSVCFHE